MTPIEERGDPAALVPFSSAHAAPVTSAFADSTDCHMHFFDARVPLYKGATVTHPDTTPEQYRALQRLTGTSRCVVVQPSAYGYDNRPTLAGVAAMGEGARGVAVVPADVPDSMLQQLHAGGIRGVRFNLVQPGGLTLDDAHKLAPRLHALGWHIQFQLPPGGIAGSLDALLKVPGRLVFDHMGRVAGLEDASMTALLRLLETGRSWVKLSAPYLDSKSPGPAARGVAQAVPQGVAYADRIAVAQRLVRAAPERMLWGSDWPHATEARKPDDAVLFDLLATWTADEGVRRKILVENPATLYGFT